MNMYPNPMLDYQRNNLLAQQQMIQNQLNQLDSQRQFNPYPKAVDPFHVKQVGSIEEAKGWPVDPGVIYLFPDTGTGDIYLKRLNTENGKSELITYKPSDNDAALAKEVPTMESRLDSIERKIGEIYESISSIAKSRAADVQSVRHDAAGDVGEDAPLKSSEIRSSKQDARR